MARLRSAGDMLRELDTSLVRAKQRLRRVAAAPFYGRVVRRRQQLDHVTFIGITGSCGKTTTKELIATALSTLGPGRRSDGTRNSATELVRIMRQLDAGDRFCVMEASGHGPGAMDQLLNLLRPQVGVVTNVGSDHWARFGSLDGIAAEKSKLVACLPPNGVAVLNADDHRVMAMGERCSARVLTYGVEHEADLRAVNVTSAWPDRLRFDVLFRGQSYPVQTRLLGTHWAPDVMAALAVATEMGVPLPDAIRAIGAMEPTRQRMYPDAHPDGVTFVHDDNKAPLWSVPHALKFLREARAPRRIAVIGTISDRRKMSDQKAKDDRAYRDVALEALDSADHVVFVGYQAKYALRAQHPRAHKLRTFPRIKEAAAYLRDFVQSGDLVLIKGSHRMDHLMRIPLSRTMTVRCWRGYCARTKTCDRCMFVGVPFGA